jgi:hypothetical protein
LDEICDVCGGALDEENVSRCTLCGREFHMAWSSDAQVKNCGRVSFSELHCSMAFACSICLAQNPELSQSLIDIGPGPPPF